MWLAFDAEWEGDSEIYIVKGDGEALTKLTDNDIRDFRPLWSPDGEMIAFLSGNLSEKEYRLYVMNVDGSQTTLVSADLRVPGDYAWSPDSHKLAFDARRGDGPANLYIASADGSSLKAVTQNDGRLALIGSTTWSPDGQTIAFSAALDERFLIWHVFRVGSDGSTFRDLSPETARVEDSPGWHPTADLVLFYLQTASSLSQLYVMNADGSERRQLTTGEGLKGSAFWSPDGELVAYEVSDDSLYSSPEHDVDTIYVVSEDRSKTQIVYVAEKWAKLAGWAPDSRHLALTLSHGQTWELAVLDICDGSLSAIVEDVSGRHRASWKP